MEIHDEGILSDFLFGMKKGACAPFYCPNLAFDQARLITLPPFSCRSPYRSEARRAVTMQER